MNGHRRSSGTYQQQGGGSPNGAHPQLLSVNGLADGDDEVEDEEAASPLHRKHPAVQHTSATAPEPSPKRFAAVQVRSCCLRSLRKAHSQVHMNKDVEG
eukprot:1154939-Pelagomonas_calceolata.AAC.8